MGILRAGLLVLLMAGCATVPEGGSDAVGPLVPTLQVSVERDTVQLDLHVTNPGADTVRLSFLTAQRYEFTIRTGPGGEEVWRWSADRMFAQVEGTEAIAPGATLRYTGAWPTGGRRGRFTAVARLTAVARGVEIAREFELP